MAEEEKPVFRVEIAEGDVGCRVEIADFGIGVGAPTRDAAMSSLNGLLRNHCIGLIQRGDTADATPRQKELAERVVKQGFELIVPEEM